MTDRRLAPAPAALGPIVWGSSFWPLAGPSSWASVLGATGSPTR